MNWIIIIYHYKFMTTFEAYQKVEVSSVVFSYWLISERDEAGLAVLESYTRPENSRSSNENGCLST